MVDPTDLVLSGAGSDLGQRLAQLIPQAVNVIQQQAQDTTQNSQSDGQSTILPNPVSITQHFGNYNPDEEVFSGGHAMGTNFGAKAGDTIAAPPGAWQVANLYDQGTTGGIGDNTNGGYGNAVLLQNQQTGERLHFTHLSKVKVGLGDMINGGQVFGHVGGTGNADAPHLNLEYYDPQGQIGDFMQSPYAQYMPLQTQG